MASVLFSTIGQAVGGPLGAAIGAAVGTSIDGALFSRRRSLGTDVAVQRSAYGEILPRLYGTSRVAGQLIWSLPIEMGGAAKGSGRRAASASFAIALSARPITGIGRIWADGREIYDSEGNFEVPLTMRVYDGQPGQVGDSLIGAAEGLQQIPDYRGLAYVVFEDFPLGAFGNRLPNLSFEVFAGLDGAHLWLKDLAEGAGLSANVPSSAPNVIGYVAGAERLSDDVDVLSNAAGACVRQDNGMFAFGMDTGLFELDANSLLMVEGGSDSGLGLSIRARPSALSLGYYDPERDYQPGRQRVASGRGGGEIESAAPLIVSASTARTMAARWLKEAETGAETIRFGLPWRWLALSVGDQVHFGDHRRWRIVQRDIRGLSLWFEAKRLPSSSAAISLAAEGGRALAAPVVPAQPTHLTLIEALVPLAGAEPAVWVAAGGEFGWRGANVRLLAGGDEVDLGAVQDQQCWGELLEPLLAGEGAVWDERNQLLVKVANGLASFESRSADDVLNGANLLSAGAELLQFRDAVFVAEGIQRLSGLLRGRFGTGFRVSNLEAGTRVVQLRPDRMLKHVYTASSLGRDLRFMAAGPGDPKGGTETMHRIEGLGLGPLAPVHFRCVRQTDGSIDASWQRCAREAWDWGGNEPSASRFQWSHQASSGMVYSLNVDGLAFNLSVADQYGLFGGALPAGACWLTAIGEGPVEQRRSRLVQI